MNEAAVLRMRNDVPWVPLVSRVTAAVAAIAELPVDRLMEAGIALESIAQSSRAAGLEEVCARFVITGERLRVRIGPMRSVEAVVAGASPRGAGPVLERLSDECRVETSDGAGFIELEFGPG